ncbi:hypothetical protein K488DRAFT_40545, partial [Vararia minispora EC-137]
MPVWNGCFSEVNASTAAIPRLTLSCLQLALYKSSEHLRPLQGYVVPTVIAAHLSDKSHNVAMEPPHPIWWFEASSSIPDVLKAKIVVAYQRIHAQGVLHGDVALRHMLIGAD